MSTRLQRSYGKKKAAEALQRSCEACVQSKQRDGVQRPKNGLGNRKFEPDSRTATARNLLQRTIRFWRMKSDSLPKCSQNVKIESFGLIKIMMEARTSKKPRKWVQICVSGSVHFSHRFLEMLFEPKGCHRECQGCAEVSKRDTKSRPEVAMEASEGMSENVFFSIVKRYF